MKKDKLKKEGAITLIALIVTVIVLLILAGVTVMLLLESNGVINITKKAKEENIASRELETIISATQTAFLEGRGEIDFSDTEGYKDRKGNLKNNLEKFGIDTSGYDSSTGKLTIGGNIYEIGEDGSVTIKDNDKEETGNIVIGNTTGGNTSGGNTSSGNTTGGNTSSGNTTGGNTTGGNTSSGNTTGGNTTGGDITDENTTGGDPVIATHKLNIDIIFGHELSSASMEYTAMTVTVKNALGEETVMNLGNDSPDFTYLTSSQSGNGFVTYRLNTAMDIKEGYRYNVVFEGLGYRKFTATFVPMQDTKVTAWDYVMTTPQPCVNWDTENTYYATFLSGDIVADGIIDKYDTAQISSWYGATVTEIGSVKHKCDINRDGEVGIRDNSAAQLNFGY